MPEAVGVSTFFGRLKPLKEYLALRLTFMCLEVTVLLTVADAKRHNDASLEQPFERPAYALPHLRGTFRGAHGDVLARSHGSLSD
jgi:hypothetical protein